MYSRKKFVEYSPLIVKWIDHMFEHAHEKSGMKHTGLLIFMELYLILTNIVMN